MFFGIIHADMRPDNIIYNAHPRLLIDLVACRFCTHQSDDNWEEIVISERD
jgi:hypothetical protein